MPADQILADDDGWLLSLAGELALLRRSSGSADRREGASRAHAVGRRSSRAAQVEAEATLEGARLRAAADTAAAEAALRDAREEAERIVAAAHEQAAAVRDAARREGEAAARKGLRDELAAACAEQERLKAQAPADAETAVEREWLLTEAREVLAAAQAERERLLGAAAEEIARAHEAAQTQIEAERAAGRAQVQREVGELAAELRASADEELEAYVQRRRREIDRLAQAARRDRFS